MIFLTTILQLRWLFRQSLCPRREVPWQSERLRVRMPAWVQWETLSLVSVCQFNFSIYYEEINKYEKKIFGFYSCISIPIYFADFWFYRLSVADVQVQVQTGPSRPSPVYPTLSQNPNFPPIQCSQFSGTEQELMHTLIYWIDIYFLGLLEHCCDPHSTLNSPVSDSYWVIKTYT